MDKTYIAIDLKSFYASVECVERGLDPLKTNLVVADEGRTEKTICLAVTPPLKAYGLSGRSRLFEVVEKAREIKMTTGRELEYIVAKPRMGLYMEYSANIYSIYLRYVSKEDIHIYSVDEVFIDVTNYLFMYKKTPGELTKMIINDVLAETGITATAGIAPNLYLCKIAMDIVAKHSKPDENGVRIAQLDVMSYRKLLWNHRPLTDFWMTGSGTEKRLNQNGMFTMADVARFSLFAEDVLYKIFGVNAELIIDHAWGYESCTLQDIKNYRPKINSLTSGQVLSKPYSADETRVIVREMTELLVLDLVAKGLATSSVTLNIGYDRDNKIERKSAVYDRYGRLIPAPSGGTVNLDNFTSSTEKITGAVMKLFDRIIDKELFVRRITINANRVIEQKYVQYDLFSNPLKTKNERSIQETIVGLQNRFGKNAVLKGFNLLDCGTTIERNTQIGGHNA